MRALVKRGYKVQPYKIGPDFIDPGFHFFATRQVSRNLDGYIMSPGNVLETFQRNFNDADLAVIEGTMGLYDSHNALDQKGSTAETSKILRSPVILIANVERIARTAAALVLGYKLFDRDVDIQGVILNRVGSERHASKVRVAVEKLADMRVVGVLPRNPNILIPERHLGLVPAHERRNIEELFDHLAEVVEEHIDVDSLIEIAQKAPELEEVEKNELFNPRRKFNVTIGVLKDAAFNFYYQDVIDAMASASSGIRYIDAINDDALPEVDALYIGGGFPEVFASQLQENSSLRTEIREFCEDGKPVYAECGGLMYLGRRLITPRGAYKMVGFLPIDTKMMQGFQALGYARRVALTDSPVARKGDVLLGHEFHYSKVRLWDKVDYAFKTTRGKGVDGVHDGIIKKNTVAGYLHFHVLAYPRMIENFLGLAERVKKE
jgi:cobyrinic acid a,c-diamide synthase